ncbi:hypothetical protein J0A67_16270 [Algoriphagus aestuariicola]|uniref:DUF6438 domain-containing protein n=1 Tax=Algoriphagus aestuariicola TaxID=1852016 RepID=A0ABS3BTP7_9BACT|nr:DUF6438 domain-containing protein [Algoriphagus aestuariicola]MBN7802426.1 hypothetical protein [Algoriphagus aestuariicola]MBN7802430.1 hypothetical protein [Algoriphagus aestuariicola]
MRLLIIGLLLIGCSIENKIESPTINGDWIFIENPEEITIDYFGLKFKNDTLYTIHDGGLTQEGKFLVNGDTIIVSEFGEKINKTRRIKKLTKDSLILTGGIFEDKYYSRQLEFVEKLKFNEIKLTAGKCFGDCPEFNLRITDSGLIQFKPINNCKVDKEKTFTIEREKKRKIDSLFQWTYIHKLDTSKVNSAIDDWALGIEISYGNGQRIVFRTTGSYIPFRLKGIFSLIINDLRERNLI